MGRVEGKVAFITGAARGQGRSHAVRLAEEGADIIAVDICRSLPTVPYEGATRADLDATAKLVEDLDRRVVVREADVRDLGQLDAAVREGLSELGHIDVVCCNAGIGTFGPALEMDEQTWQEMIDINLTGVWKTIRAAVPPMVERRQGGSVIVTSSAAGLFGVPNLAHYCTPMIMNDAFSRLARPDLTNPQPEDMGAAFIGNNALPVPWVEPIDISNAVLWLASDESRYVTGVTLPVDAGFCVKVGGTPSVLAE
jgi:NAD(P)-dependent dehydrogenase (short-subunit alcohol dehydrogenase family)